MEFSAETMPFMLRLRERLIIRLINFVRPMYVHWARRGRPAWQQDLPRLLSYERGSLGYALGRFLAYSRMELIPRFEDRAVFHVLLGYEWNVLGASEMQFCLLGNGQRSLCVLGTCAIAWLAFPEYRANFRNVFLKGQQLRPFYHWYFEYLLTEDIDELRSFIGITGLKSDGNLVTSHEKIIF